MGIVQDFEAGGEAVLTCFESLLILEAEMSK